MAEKRRKVFARIGIAFLILTGAIALTGLGNTVDIKSRILRNSSAYIPPQCYAVVKTGTGAIRNSCYPCHSNPTPPSMIYDDDLQLEYAFPASAETNNWTNLTTDRTQKAASISDNKILDYIRSSNYFDSSGGISIAGRLASPPSSWDFDADGVWDGYVPDCRFNFDNEGFDRDTSDSPTGWRAYASYPFPSTHWPANGGFADVMIRLPEPFRRTAAGAEDYEIYKINLAILEALIKKADITITTPADERTYGVDLDKNGTLGLATRVVYDWAPLEGRFMSYVGEAGRLQRDGTVQLAAGLFPAGTEFLQTIRYLDPAGSYIAPSARFKEIRYARKIKWYTYAELQVLSLDEVKERSDFPDRLKLPVGNSEAGVTNGRGWVFAGFIEDTGGDLRPQSFEETTSCIGCHGGTGAGVDSTISFRRKLDSREYQGGWFHWSQKDMKGINEPKVEFKNAGLQYEYSFYLMYTRGADEFQANTEAREKFLTAGGLLKPEMARALHEDISILLYPSPERALALNKIYKTIVEDQSFALGREPVTEKANLHDEIEAADLATGVEKPIVQVVDARDFPGKFGGKQIDQSIRAEIEGDGMEGPDGQRYQIDWNGRIEESSYGLTADGLYFAFPPRHTLPTRIIVPNSDIAGCYTCHRLTAPMPADDPQVAVPVSLPLRTSTEPGLYLSQLTRDSSTDINGQWSPDGTRIAFESDRSGDFQIWVMNADGSKPVQVSRGAAKHGWPNWSPDGTRLVFWGYDESSGISSISTAGFDGNGHQTLVESEGMLDRPEYRPDGRFIAYAAEAAGNWDIWVTDLASKKYRLTYDAQMETNPLWSPDGNIIAYKAAPNKAYNLTIENFIFVEDGMENPRFLLWDGIKSIQMNDFSPDGKQIVYTAEIVTNSSGEDRVSYLAVVNDLVLKGGQTAGKAVVLSTNTLGDRGPVFSPDGESVAFWAWDTSYRATLWIAGTDGGALRQITTEGNDMYPRFSPDGKKLLFESSRGGNMDIWTVNLK